MKQNDKEELLNEEEVVNINELDIPIYLIEKYESENNDKTNLIKELLFHTNKNVIKFALRSLRTYNLKASEINFSMKHLIA